MDSACYRMITACTSGTYTHNKDSSYLKSCFSSIFVLTFVLFLYMCHPIIISEYFAVSFKYLVLNSPDPHDSLFLFFTFMLELLQSPFHLSSSVFPSISAASDSLLPSSRHSCSQQQLDWSKLPWLSLQQHIDQPRGREQGRGEERRKEGVVRGGVVCSHFFLSFGISFFTLENEDRTRQMEELWCQSFWQGSSARHRREDYIGEACWLKHFHCVKCEEVAVQCKVRAGSLAHKAAHINVLAMQGFLSTDS